MRAISSKYEIGRIHYHEDDRAQRLLNIFPKANENSQFNVSYVNSNNHVVAWHGHHAQTDQWVCLKGSFKIGLAIPEPGSHGEKFTIKFMYLSDKNVNQCLTIPPGILHGYKALEQDSILLYHVTEKYDILDEIKFPVGFFNEDWSTKNE